MRQHARRARGGGQARVEHDGVDTVFTVELLANRGDHYCYEGVARELDGRLGVGVCDARPWPSSRWASRRGTSSSCETDLCLRSTPPPCWSAARRKAKSAGCRGPPGARGRRRDPQPRGPDRRHQRGKPGARPADPCVRRGQAGGRGHDPGLAKAGETALPLVRRRAGGRCRRRHSRDRRRREDPRHRGGDRLRGVEDHPRRPPGILLESATFDPVAVRKASRALRHPHRLVGPVRARIRPRPAVGRRGARGASSSRRAPAGSAPAPPDVVGSWHRPRSARSGRPRCKTRANTFLGVELDASLYRSRSGSTRYGFTAHVRRRPLGPSGSRTWRLVGRRVQPPICTRSSPRALGYDETTPVERSRTWLARGARPRRG